MIKTALLILLISSTNPVICSDAVCPYGICKFEDGSVGCCYPDDRPDDEEEEGT